MRKEGDVQIMISEKARVVGLVGSPGRGGNTERLLDRFLAGAEKAGAQVLKIPVADLGLQGWTPEVECPGEGRHMALEEWQRVSEELVACDVLAVASPVYFRNVPAQLKALIDLGQCQWIRKYVDKKPLPASRAGHERRRGALISAGGSSREHFVGMIQTIKSFFDVYETDYWGELLLAGVDTGQVDEEPLAFQQAYDLGFRAVAETWK